MLEAKAAYLTGIAGGYLFLPLSWSEPLLKHTIYTENDIVAILGIGRGSAYKLANSRLFKTIRISRKSFGD